MIRQLKLDNDFKNITDDTFIYSNISKKIYDYSYNLISNIIFIDNNKKYCSCCLSEITNSTCENKYCHNHNRIIKNKKDINIKDIRNYKNTIYLLEFEIIHENKIYLNKYKIDYYYDNELIIKPKLLFDINKIKKYEIYKQGLYDVYKDEFIYYENTVILDFEDNITAYLYIDNLEDLKNTKLYKYTNIWKIKDQIKKDTSIYEITYSPICKKEFEYLVKMKLYNLALDSNIEFKGNFIDTFGVEKKYLPFMVKNNITELQLEALKLYKTENIKELDLIGYNLNIFKNIKKIKCSINYIHNVLNDKIDFYLRYLNICNELKLDLSSKQILCPKNLKEAYKKRCMEYEFKNDIYSEKTMNSIYEMLKINSYEDDNYIIRPAKDYDDLLEESCQMSNCVSDYYEKIVYENSNIYFLRKKENINESFITIEVQKNKIVQAYEKYNEDVRKELLPLLNKWESNLIEIV